MKEKHYNTIINGITPSCYPKVSVDYGYRDSTYFWYTKFKKPIKEKNTAKKEADLSGVMYAANRVDDVVEFSEDACQTLVKVPRVFLKLVLQGCVSWARENNVALMAADHMKIINDK